MRLQLALDGEPGAQPPDAWVISRICEEFHCLPSQARRELAEHDGDLVFDILSLRSYVRAKQRVDDATSEMDVPKTPAVRMVFEVQAELMRMRKGTS